MISPPISNPMIVSTLGNSGSRAPLRRWRKGLIKYLANLDEFKQVPQYTNQASRNLGLGHWKRLVSHTDAVWEG
jgi:hypothetical protein